MLSLALGAALWTAVSTAALGPVSAQARLDGDPDALYEAREDLPSAVEAAAIWEARGTHDARDFEAAWKLARACYWLGGHVPEAERRRQYERGIAAAERAVALHPDRPEGHFWLAANMGAMAESFGLRAGLKYRGPVKRELETVLRLDPAFQLGSADRALGRWYFKVPALFGGSKKKSVEHLERSLRYDPSSAASHFFLAEALIDMDRRAEARRALQQVLDAPITPEWGPETREFQQKARALLARLR
jgi:tetratricopeptide (TPR) repeat protein